MCIMLCLLILRSLRILEMIDQPSKKKNLFKRTVHVGFDFLVVFSIHKRRIENELCLVLQYLHYIDKHYSLY